MTDQKRPDKSGPTRVPGNPLACPVPCARAPCPVPVPRAPVPVPATTDNALGPPHRSAMIAGSLW